MNDMNKMLMLPVERIVRPIIASSAHKMRMREELYTHFEQIYLEERQSSEDEKLALETAKTRLGTPDQLRTELQQTISKREYLTATYNSLFSRNPRESRLRFSVRMGLLQALLQMGAYLIPILVGALFFSEKNFLAIAPLLVVISLLTGWNAFVGLYLSQAFIEPTAIIQGRKRGLSLAGSLFGLSMAASVVLMWMSIPGGWKVTQIAAIPSAIAFFAGWGLFYLVVWLLKTERERTAPWEMLELAE